jgi:hypothetical protein
MLLSAFKMPLCIPLFRAAWLISGNGETGCRAIVAVRAMKGLQAARVQARLAMRRLPCPRIAAFAGIMEIQAGKCESARAMFIRGRQLGDDPAGRLDLLEILLAAFDPQQEASAVAARLDCRRDLPPYVSKCVNLELIWSGLLRGQHQDARRRATHLLKIEEVPEARMAMWVVESLAGNEAAANAHRDRAQMPSDSQVYLEVLGHAIIGNLEKSRQLLEQLRQSNPKSAELAQRHLQGIREGQPCSR